MTDWEKVWTGVDDWINKYVVKDLYQEWEDFQKEVQRLVEEFTYGV